MGPVAPYAAAPPSGLASDFRADDFAWSARTGSGAIAGSLGFRTPASRYTCQGGDVILTPETAWTRRRMFILYGSPVAAAVPLDIVRARTPSAPSGDYARFAKKAVCDGDRPVQFHRAAGRRLVRDYPRKASRRAGEPIAVMRRVETRGSLRSVTLN